jgi:hypothetical protein
VEEKQKKQTGKKSELKLIEYGCAYADAVEEKEKAENQIKELKAKILSEMKELDKDEFVLENVEVETDEKAQNINFKLVKQRRIKYDAERLKNRLKRSVFKKIAKRNIKIIDYTKFRKIMEKYKVPYIRVKDCLDVSYDIDTQAIKNLYEIGELDLLDISDCYEVSISEFIKMTKK